MFMKEKSGINILVYLPTNKKDIKELKMNTRKEKLHDHERETLINNNSFLYRLCWYRKLRNYAPCVRQVTKINCFYFAGFIDQREIIHKIMKTTRSRISLRDTKIQMENITLTEYVETSNQFEVCRKSSNYQTHQIILIRDMIQGKMVKLVMLLNFLVKFHLRMQLKFESVH